MKRASILLLAAIAGGACSRATQNAEPGEIEATGAVQYVGTFRNTQQADGGLRMSSVFQANGSVQVLYREATGRSLVNLVLSTSGGSSEVLAWAILPGRCGSGSAPLAPSAQFPPLEFGNNSRVELTNVSIPIVMPPGTYHLNVYRGGENLANVVVCTNLSQRR